MAKENPKVTAIIPLHNHEKWIKDAILSIATQDFRPLRIVVVDDGSKDGSVAEVLSLLTVYSSQHNIYVGKLRDHNANLMLIKLPNPTGPANARNIGIQQVFDDTDIFAFLDSDDVYEQGKISKSVAKFEEFGVHCGVVYSDYETFRSDSVRIREYKEPYSRKRLLEECIINCDSLVSKKVFETVGFFDPELRVAEDYDLWLRASEHFLCFHIPEHLVSIRVGVHSSTSTVKSEVWKKCWNRVMEKTKERLQRGS
jgi:glycosyltransferase involved in cell wall biosynthesis